MFSQGKKWMENNQRQKEEFERSRQPSAGLFGYRAGDDYSLYFTRCGDCGHFLKKERWIRKDNTSGYQKALCYGCRSNYED